MNSLIDFAKKHPWPPGWPEETLRRFLTDLVSGPEFVLDLEDKGERVAVAALLDKVQNKGNNANLEILGLMAPEFLGRVVGWGKERVPGHRSGLELGFHHSFVGHERFASEHGLRPYYEMYEMLNNHPASQCLKNEFTFVLARPEDQKELYQVLCECFRDNVDTGIPPFEEWSKRKAPIWVVRREGGIVGFVNLIGDEIRTVGVLPSWRGKGLAGGLIRHALAHSGKSCRLNVAVQNQRALGLYRRLGFREVDHSFVYRWTK